MADSYLVPENAPLKRHKLGALASLGRHPENTIPVQDRSVSKFHAQIQRGGDGNHHLQDLGSRNGTYVEGQRVDRCVLDDGMEVVLGTVRFRYHQEYEAPQVTSMLQVPDILKTGGSVAVLGPSTGARLPKVKVTEAESEIQHSDVFQVDEDNFLPASKIHDLDQLKRDYEKLRVAHELSTALRLDAPLEELLRDIVRRMFKLISADRCAILLLTPDGKTLEPRVVMEKGGGVPSEAMPLSQTVLDEVITQKKAILSTDAITDGRFQAAASIVALNMRSAMCVPVTYEDELFGALHADSLLHTGAFEKKDLQILTSVASQVAVALKNVSLVQQIQKEVETRALLGRLLSPNLVEEVVAGKLDMKSGGEKRTAAVMFTDIRGFTAMSAMMDASEVTQMLNEYFEVMADVLFDHGGTLDKYIGDAIMALFGVPRANEDAALCAVRCAIGMQSALRSLNRTRQARGDPSIGMGIGVNFGEVIWGPLGSRKTMDYTVVGDVVNVASRLCSLAKVEEVIISQSTYESVEEQIHVQPLPPTKVKGKAEPLMVYRVLGETE